MPRMHWRLASLFLSLVVLISQSVATTAPARANHAAGPAYAPTTESGGVPTPGVIGSDPSAAGIPGTSQYSNAPGLDPLAPLFVVRAKRGGPIVRAGPSDTATPLSGLYYDT